MKRVLPGYTMAETKLVYLYDSRMFEAQAVVTKIGKGAEGKTDVQLDETIFYPQGGGQPSDQGTISTPEAEFRVEEARFEDGVVHHYGTMLKGSLVICERVKLCVDAERRTTNMRNHSAGHVVASAMSELRPELKPVKGYHFPDGPYVQFEGAVAPEERQKLLEMLQEKVRQMIAGRLRLITRFVSYEELTRVCRFVPDNMPKDKPSRIVAIEGYISVPDGGTQVRGTGEIGTLTITRIKAKGNDTIVSYRTD